MTEDGLFDHAARRASSRVFFLGSVLAAYTQIEGLDDSALADLLGCRPAILPALRLCRRPTTDAPAFRSDVEQIAERFGADPVRLAEVVRRVDALEALRGASADGEVAYLAAARDREDEPGGSS